MSRIVKALRIVSIISMVIGVLSIIGSIVPVEPYGLIGGSLFLLEGALAREYIRQQEGK